MQQVKRRESERGKHVHLGYLLTSIIQWVINIGWIRKVANNLILYGWKWWREWKNILFARTSGWGICIAARTFTLTGQWVMRVKGIHVCGIYWAISIVPLILRMEEDFRFSTRLCVWSNTRGERNTRAVSRSTWSREIVCTRFINPTLCRWSISPWDGFTLSCLIKDKLIHNLLHSQVRTSVECFHSSRRINVTQTDGTDKERRRSESRVHATSDGLNVKLIVMEQ